MSLTEEYRGQVEWRSWSTAWNLLPDVTGQVVIDTGCGIGDQAVVFAERGARIVGVDLNEELLTVARNRAVRNAEFRAGDFRDLRDVDVVADPLTCPFICPGSNRTRRELKNIEPSFHLPGFGRIEVSL
jgi:ubiquinone/menaquinone biosynthesis C-methylase UbiE